jgi:hypothetical protein
MLHILEQEQDKEEEREAQKNGLSGEQLTALER